MADNHLFLYVVDRDFGFAPNPFHGTCTLATCKPRIRKGAQIGDWVGGIGGKRLKATGKCIFLMKVDQKITFNEYWNHPDFRDKRPVRNGSNTMLVGDNIYHLEGDNNWIQEDSHHSHSDGSINYSNLNNDTKADAVLISRKFYYFGKSAPDVPKYIFENMGYKNGIGHRKYPLNTKGNEFVSWIQANFRDEQNLVSDDPFQFSSSHSRYSAETNKIT